MRARSVGLLLTAAVLMGLLGVVREAAGRPVETSTKYDYVIIVPSADQVSAVNALKTWKEQIGFSVRVVTVTEIYQAYTSGDNAARIWNYLHDRYLPSAWGIRYVLLVGDIDKLPIRLLYPDGGPNDGGAYGSDYYYANLDVTAWDVDNDNRWGEFTQDNLDSHAEVLVGRIPFNDSATITSVANHIINFEKDIGDWKRKALLSHGLIGITDLTTRLDAAETGEQIRSDFQAPYGWTFTTQYEHKGLSPSIYPSPLDLNQTDFENACGLKTQGVVNVNMHGNPTEMGGIYWVVDVDGDSRFDPDPPLNEGAWSDASIASRIAAHPTNGVVFLCGCSTGAIVGDDPNFASSPLRSLYLITTPRPGIMIKEYLRAGSPAVIGSTAGSDTGSHPFNHLFYKHLIGDDDRVGDAFYAAHEEFAQQNGFFRAIRVYNLFGDPSLLLKGIENRPGGKDTLIKEGKYYAYAGDNDDNATSDMYVGILTTSPSTSPGTIAVYRSQDHGQTWGPWASVSDDSQAITDLDVLVSRDTSDPPDCLHVAYTTPDGQVKDVRINLATPDSSDTRLIAQTGTTATHIALARQPVPMPGDFDIYAAWEYQQSGSQLIVAYTSANNGDAWNLSYWIASPNVGGMRMPSIDAGPNNRVYLAALTASAPQDVLLLRSVDGGSNWSSPVNLTQGDGAQTHNAPAVGLSSDPSYPGVWVAYDYQFQDPVWGTSKDIRFAYSANAGDNWTKNKVLSGDIGRDEWLPDLATFRSYANRWVNLAYNSDTPASIGNTRHVIWRWASGGLPANWSARRIINKNAAAAPYSDAPVALYSPFAGVPGSGVVYGGANRTNIYYAYPGLATSSGQLQPEQAAESLPPPVLSEPPAENTHQVPPAIAPAEQPLVWAETGDLPGATASVALAAGPGSLLYAIGVRPVEDGNTGSLYRSSNTGASWERVGDLPGSWSLMSLLVTPQGSLLAGGLALEGTPPSVEAHAAIYRSVNGGQNWQRVLDVGNAAVYRLYQAPTGVLFAGTGWQGQLFRSHDDGAHWEPLTPTGAGHTLHALLWTSTGTLLAGVEGPTAGAILRSTNQGLNWTPAAGLANVHAVYDLLEVGERLYAAVRRQDGGFIYRSDASGASWTAEPAPQGAIEAVRCLYRDVAGGLFAGAEVGNRQAATRVFRRDPVSGNWQAYRGWIDLATTVYDLLSTEHGLYAATGYVYGNVYRVRSTQDGLLWLPIIQRGTTQ